MESRRELGMKYFRQGYNCSQSVVLAYLDLLDMEKEQAMKMSQPFGGGMGRMRQVCGAVSGMFFVLGALKGSAAPENLEAKKETYDFVQKLAADFEEKNGSIICRQLLGLEEKQSSVGEAFRIGTTPEPRSEEYYKKRPCESLVGDACEIMEEFLR